MDLLKNEQFMIWYILFLTTVFYPSIVLNQIWHGNKFKPFTQEEFDNRFIDYLNDHSSEFLSEKQIQDIKIWGTKDGDTGKLDGHNSELKKECLSMRFLVLIFGFIYFACLIIYVANNLHIVRKE